MHMWLTFCCAVLLGKKVTLEVNEADILKTHCFPHLDIQSEEPNMAQTTSHSPPGFLDLAHLQDPRAR